MSGPVVVSARPSLPTRLRRVWAYRELLVGLVRKELKVKYKNSVLGFAWSMLNPALYLVVFWFVFEKVMNNGVPRFPIFLLSGLLVWNLFSVALGSATGSMVDNAGLIKKVAFPREVLPLASVGAAVVHFFLQLVVLVLALIGFRNEVDLPYLALLPFALVVTVLLAAGIGVLLSALNVYLRDIKHIIDLLLLAWFWFTPIVWPFRSLAESGSTAESVTLLNPITPVVLAFQRALYARLDGQNGPILPDWSVAHHLALLAGVGGFALVMLVLGEVVFGRLEGDFAEEL
jgi:ABC-2 type transport system permease protein